MGLFSKFRKNKAAKEPARSDSILTPEAQADQEKVEHKLNPETATAEEKRLQKFEELKPRIYPSIHPANTPSVMPFDAGGQKIDVPLPFIPFHAATKIFFVEDTGTKLRVLQKSAIPESVSLLELLNIAVRNLAQNVKLEVRATNFGGYIVVGNPNHVISSILIKGLWKELAKKLDDSLIIAIPVREVIMFIPAKKRNELLPQMANACVGLVKDPRHRTHPLTPLLFYYDRDAEKLSTFAVQKGTGKPAAAPKEEPAVSEEEFPAAPLEEELPKAPSDRPSGPPHLRIVPKPGEEEED